MTSQPTKILLCITKSNFGGAQRYVCDLAIGLKKRGYSVSVALGGSGELSRRLTAAGIEIHEISTLGRDISFVRDVISFWKLGKIIRDVDPDILHANSSKAGLLCAFLGRIMGVPRVIFTAHGWAHNEDRSKLTRALLWTLHALTILFSHATIVVSEKSRQQMDYPLIRKKMHVVHNGISPCTYMTRDDARHALIESHRELGAYKDDPWSLTIGELHPTKQHTVSIEAMKHVVTHYPNARHIIIGDGEEYHRLNTQIATAQLSTNVFLLGRVPDAARYIRAGDLFILPSRTEALPYVILEAAQAGLPIIASDVGGISEIVADHTSAVLIRSGDVPALAEAYVRYLRDAELRTSHGRAAETHSASYTLEAMLDNTILIYR